MAGRISEADKERVRDLNRIESVVGEYVALRPAGGGNLKGLCPFHDEKSPSFHVRPNHGLYHCFGCGEGGDVYSCLLYTSDAAALAAAEAVERAVRGAHVERRRLLVVERAEPLLGPAAGEELVNVMSGDY